MVWHIQDVDKKLLKKQMDTISKSKDIPTDIKEGVLNMLADIYNEVGEFYDVSAMSKDDIESAWEGNDKFSKALLKKLDNEEMKYIARKMGDNFCECCYWNILRVLTEDKVLKEKGK